MQLAQGGLTQSELQKEAVENCAEFCLAEEVKRDCVASMSQGQNPTVEISAATCFAEDGNTEAFSSCAMQGATVKGGQDANRAMRMRRTVQLAGGFAQEAKGEL